MGVQPVIAHRGPSCYNPRRGRARSGGRAPLCGSLPRVGGILVASTRLIPLHSPFQSSWQDEHEGGSSPRPGSGWFGLLGADSPPEREGGAVAPSLLRVPRSSARSELASCAHLCISQRAVSSESQPISRPTLSTKTPSSWARKKASIPCSFRAESIHGPEPSQHPPPSSPLNHPSDARWLRAWYRIFQQKNARPPRTGVCCWES